MIAATVNQDITKICFEENTNLLFYIVIILIKLKGIIMEARFRHGIKKK